VDTVSFAPEKKILFPIQSYGEKFLGDIRQIVVSFTTHGFNKADILVKVASNIIKSDLLLEENDLHLNTAV
jgi:hypothetical protein